VEKKWVGERVLPTLPGVQVQHGKGMRMGAQHTQHTQHILL